MRYLKVKVRRDTQTTSNSLVSPWELPILEFLFEAGNVEVVGEAVSTREYPDAASEFARLAKVYGGDTKSGISHVQSVYGEGRRGVQSLQDAIDEATEEDAASKKPSPAVRGHGRKVKLSADPLLA